MGFRAAKVLFDLLEGKDGHVADQLPAIVQIRDSVCPPREDS
jgi:LacI family transcriptional regulator